MKAIIQANRDYIVSKLGGEPTCDPYKMLWSAVFESMTPDNIVGWYRDCGYIVWIVLLIKFQHFPDGYSFPCHSI